MNPLRRVVIALVSTTMLSGAAWAADVTCVIEIENGEPKEGSEIVAWLENESEFEVPKEQLSISQRGTQFNPRFLVVVKGQSVAMPNDDNVAHNVFSFSKGNKFNLGIYPKGQFKSVIAKEVGEVDIYCSVHQHMQAKILVVPSPYHVRFEEKDRATIKQVPPGKYELKIWHGGIIEDAGPVLVTEEPLSVTAELDFAGKK